MALASGLAFASSGDPSMKLCGARVSANGYQYGIDGAGSSHINLGINGNRVFY